MMLFDTPPLDIFGVYDRGIPNKERIVLRSSSYVDLSKYFVFLGVRAPMKADVVFPISDQFLWLGNGSIDGNSWVFIFTGKGNPSVTSESSTKEPVQSIFWNKSTVVLEDSDVVPALCHWDTLIIGNKAPRHTNEILEQKKAQLEKPDWARILATLGNPNKR